MLIIRNILVLMTIGYLLTAVSCNKNSDEFNMEDLSNPVSIYPVPPSVWVNSSGGPYFSSGFVGDVMPFFNDGIFHIYYLHDGDGKNGGYHPIHEFTTKDNLHYDYKGRTIPFGNDSDQDRAIGTGSVIKAGDTYYFYYTGHNDLHWNSGEPVEGVMYATSTDLTNWTKHSGFLLYPDTNEGYGANDFRDPFVFYNQDTNEYWMLVSAFHNNIPVIALYTTKELSSDDWKLRNPFYESDNTAYGVLECSDLFKMGDYWYLIFSENGVDKTTHYRMASSIDGPWIKPAVDVLDGAFYYAAKTASDGNNRYLFGWVYRKSGETDYGDKIWGGNLVTHQLLQNSDGTLSTKSPEIKTDLFAKNQPLSQGEMANASFSNNNYTLDDNGFVQLGLMEGQKKITTNIKGLDASGEAGFFFGYARPDGGDYYKLRFENNTAYLSKIQGPDEYIDCQIPFDADPGTDLNVEIIIENSVYVVTINGQTTLTGRSYWLPGAKWGIYSSQGGVTFQNIKLFSY